jgi:hypothetical protein
MSGLTKILSSLAPLAWALVPWGLAQVPAVVARFPAVGMFGGALGGAFVVLGAGIALVRVSPRWKVPDPPPWLLFVTSFGLLLIVGLHYASRLRVSGDEPHYLLMAQSLWREHDLDLRDNFEREDFLEYTPGPLAPHYGTPRRDGRPYPAHSPGLPMLLAPIYAFGGRLACVAFLSLIGAALGLEARRLALRFVPKAGSPLLAWAAAVGPPSAFYAFHIYTELPSALALAFCLRVLLSAPTPLWASAAALAACALPWLHMKMIPVAAGLGVLALLKLRGRSLVLFLMVAVLMAAGYLGYHQYVFGKPSPLAVYGGLPPEFSAPVPLRALLGMLLDRSFGLLPHAPVFLLALAGFVRLVARPTRDGVVLVVLSLLALLPAVAWRMWWGGQCPPGRFLVPLVPLLAVLVAIRASQGPSRGLLRWQWSLVAAGGALTLFMIARPGALLFLNRGDRPTRLWTALSGPVPLQRYLPSAVSGGAAEQRVAALWIGAIALLLLLDVLAERHEAANRLFGGPGLPVCLLLLVGALVDGWARLSEPLTLPPATDNVANRGPR